MAELCVGAHLVTSRGIYSHHGIYLGDNRVIHYSGWSDGLTAGPIEVVSLSHFKQDSDVVVRLYKKPRYSGEEVVSRARSRLGEDDYDVHANNCEHFCTWAVTGERDSSQVAFVEDFVDVLGGTLIGTAVKIRRHYKQSSNTKEFVKDVAKTAGSSVILTGATTGLPMVRVAMLGWKVLRKVVGN